MVLSFHYLKNKLKTVDRLLSHTKKYHKIFYDNSRICELNLQCGVYAKNGGGELFILDMGEPVKIYDFAEKDDFFSRL